MKSDNPSPKKAARKTTASVPPKKTRAPKATLSAAPARTRAKSTAKKPDFTVPPALLEGDHPPVPDVSGPGRRYALGPVAVPEPPGSFTAAAELPEAYGTGQLLLTARDPHWLYARWDLTREQQQKYNARSTDRHLVLKVFADNIKGEPIDQVHVHPESTHWFVHVVRAGAKYTAQLGFYEDGGKWTAISNSGTTLTPPDAMSADGSAEFATIPMDVPFARFKEVAGAAVRENVPLAEVLRQIRASGQPVPQGSGGRWTPEQEQALGAIISMDQVRRVWMGSLEITELIRRQLSQDLSSGAFGGISSISSISSAFGGMEQQKGFWFNVNAELIIYGATEPDAQVTIGGREIKLRSDGTFSFRFALPDGEFELPAVAVSADKTDARAAELKFTRDTQYRGEVGAHPQDPQLKFPLAANVA